MEESKAKVRVLNDGATVPEETKADIKTGITSMQKFLSSLHLIVEAYAIEARMLKIKYDSLIAVKFTPEQAIELCKK